MDYTYGTVYKISSANLKMGSDEQIHYTHPWFFLSLNSSMLSPSCTWVALLISEQPNASVAGPEDLWWPR